MSPSEVPELRDIHLPPQPGFWPPAPGWWLLTLLILALLGWLATRLRRRLARRRLQRRVLADLAALTGSEDPAQAAAAVSALLKRVALTRFPRREVAPLVGEPWLAFLDRTGGDGRFRTGPGRPLAEAPYSRDSTLALPPLLDLASDWVRKNL